MAAFFDFLKIIQNYSL